ncbi:hypothetical protein [Acetobacter conturbans]|uniref:Uncharacterized protein n=1 Tax=Acetobacter conturbans TaxID=1737472 RepID=A0ABX0K3C3_9PROT|nr:hypothetical protein [Acetobacter conturbans]NHN90257.1 hypothetical protein [Acetobacter conturbans]
MTEPYEEPDLEKDKWVRIMGVYGDERVLWDRKGAGRSLEELPVPRQLRDRLVQWSESYRDRDEHSEEEWIRLDPPFDIERYAAEGFALAHAVKAVLPDWTVIYFDVSKVDYKNPYLPRYVFEREI